MSEKTDNLYESTDPTIGQQQSLRACLIVQLSRFNSFSLNSYQERTNLLKVNRIKDELLSFLLEQKYLGKQVAGFGAAAKGSTLLNFAGLKIDLVSFVSDNASSKQGKYMPGSHIPILSPAAVKDQRPDFLLVLPWNIKDEIISANSFIRQWGGQFVTVIPRLQIHQ